jgi:predicted ATP-binding protein involved in virulence
VVREAQNERESGITSPHKPQALLAGVRAAVDQVLKPSEWSHLDWDFLRGEVVANHPAQGRLPVSFLSDGIQNLLALVADLAHRAVRLNPHLGEAAPARSPGIVLIDEVDMHLHPSWQQTVIGGLQAAFPEVQFIVTTHSHLVVSTVPSACVRIIQDDGTATHPVLEVQGSESALALSEAFGVASEAPIPIVRDLSRYRRFIEEGHDTSDEAMTLRRRLDAHFGANHPVMLSVESLRRIVELRSRVARRAAPA